MHRAENIILTIFDASMFTFKRSVSISIACSFFFFLLWCPFPSAQNSTTEFNRQLYYAVFAGNNIRQVQQQLDFITTTRLDHKDAFEGALMMKKAGLIKGASQKLKVFNEGRKKLEHMIALNADNAEFRFLRLMIQENAPRALKYGSQLEADRQYIVKHYRNLSETVQKAILNYSNTSKVLSPQDF